MAKAKKGDGRLGNQFWKLRSKHGRDKLFKTPDLLWEAACEYFQWCDDNPLYETKAFNTSKEGIKDHKLEKKRVYTLQGLCIYLDCHTGYFRDFKYNLADDEKDFTTVIKRIEETIYNQKFQGAAADLFNANIIARDLGLADKRDIKSKSEVKVDIREAKEELDDLNDVIDQSG